MLQSFNSLSFIQSYQSCNSLKAERFSVLQLTIYSSLTFFVVVQRHDMVAPAFGFSAGDFIKAVGGCAGLFALKISDREDDFNICSRYLLYHIS